MEFRKHAVSWVGILVWVFMVIPTVGGQQGGKKEKETEPSYASDRIIVKFNLGVTVEQAEGVLTQAGSSKSKKLLSGRKKKGTPAAIQNTGVDNIYIVTVPDGEKVKKWAKTLEKNPMVEYAEPDYEVHVSITTPNDPYYSSTGSWGQSYRDMWGLDKIQASYAWDVQRGSPTVVVAVVDTGLDYNHPDIAANVWSNVDEIAGNGIDDDANGYVDDIRGWDFVNNDNNPMDGHGHGSHVSGTIAAVGNNGTGIVGVTWNCKIMPLKGLGDSGSGYTTDLARAIIYAADNGARLSNNSWGGAGYSQLVTDAVKYSDSHGCIVVAAAGNSTADAAGYTPAGVPEAVTVASTDTGDIKSDFSNYGTVVDVSAPGGNSLFSSSTAEYSNILSLRASGTGSDSYAVGGQYYRMRGTSMACPHASGVLALIVSQYPNRSNAWLVSQLKGTTDNINGLNPSYAGLLGTGRINAYRAVTETGLPDLVYVSHTINDVSGNNNGYADRSEAVQMSVTIRTLWGGASNIQGTLQTSDPDITITSAVGSFGTIGDDQSGNNSSSPFAFSVLGTIPSEREVVFTLTLSATGGYSIVRTFTVPVGPKLSYKTLALTDPTGNNNGIADPSETVNLAVTLWNSWGSATNVTGTLVSTDSRATVLTSTASFGNIGTNQSGSNSGSPFAVRFDPYIPFGTRMTFNLNLTATTEYTRTVSFTLGVTLDAWSTNSAVNNPISTAAHGQLFPQIVSDGNGGGFIVWEDHRGGVYGDIYAQKVRSGGVSPMPETPICVADKDQFSPQLVGDGAGGAIIVWEDFRSGSSMDIYAQRINSQGQPQWTAEGIVVCAATGDQYSPRLVSDGSGGAIVVWEDHRGSNGDVYAQKVNGSGVAQWTSNGVVVIDAVNTLLSPQLVSDASGGAIVVWKDRINIGGDPMLPSDVILAQRVNGSGSRLWNAGGVSIFGLRIAGTVEPSMMADGSGGAIVAWDDWRSQSSTLGVDVFAQKVNSSGVVQWTVNGVNVCIANGDQRYPQLTTDGSGGAMITWQDMRVVPQYFNIYAQRIGSGGAAMWTTNGVAIAATTAYDTTPQIVSDGTGGAIIAWWSDLLLMMSNIYAQRVDANGILQWGTSNVGVAVTTAQNVTGYVHFRMIGDGSGGATVAWHDYRGTDTNQAGNLDLYDVYAQRISSSLVNLSTRGYVGTGNNVMIGGLWISGTEPKKVLIRAKGPSLTGLTGLLANPTMELYGPNGLCAKNDNWQTNDPMMGTPIIWKGTWQDIQATGLAPTNTYESALLVTVPPGGYTAIIKGVNNGVGLGLVEIFEVADYPSSSRLVNISTRGYVGTGNNVMIGGLWISGTEPKKVLIRAKGPSLTGLTGLLANPTMELYGPNGLCAKNDNWQTNDPMMGTPIIWKGTWQDIQATGLAPTNTYESALLVTVPPGGYTAIIKGVSNGVGLGLVEVFEIQ